MKYIVAITILISALTSGCSTSRTFHQSYKPTVDAVTDYYDENDLMEARRKQHNTTTSVPGIRFEALSINSRELRSGEKHSVDIRAMYSKPWSMNTEIVIQKIDRERTKVSIRSLDDGQKLFRSVRDREYELERMREIERLIGQNQHMDFTGKTPAD